jgi:RNA polymerase sigma factor (TIGR02999 family)
VFRAFCSHRFAFCSGGRRANRAKQNDAKDLRREAKVAVLSVVLCYFPRYAACCSLLHRVASWGRFAHVRKEGAHSYAATPARQISKLELIQGEFRLRTSHFIAGRYRLDHNWAMSDVTRLLSSIESGDPSAAEQLLPLVYDELRKLAAARLAQEKPGQTLQATALVHDAYIRLVDVAKAQHWDSRRHFFAAAAESMRRILVERARSKNRLKRGGEQNRIPLENVDIAIEGTRLDLLALDEALNKLAAESPEQAEIVQLRYFAGLSHEEVAEMLGVSTITVKRHWRYARVWLLQQMEGTRGSPAD